jgi:predicted O-methyltransferase YrrM
MSQTVALACRVANNMPSLEVGIQVVDNSWTCFIASGTQWLNPVILSAAALQRKASREGTLRGVIATLKRLSQDDYSAFMVEYLERGLSLCGDEWGYCDLLSVLRASSELLRVETYLEIGVRRGRSVGVVVERAPQADVYGFDLWIPNYADMPNPGASFVRDELRRLNHSGGLTLIEGDSKETLPAFLAEHSDLTFDLITVDGDHSLEGARADLLNALPRLRRGGVIVMDDVAHPQHPELKQCWSECVECDPRFESAMYTDLGFGIAFAVRTS